MQHKRDLDVFKTRFLDVYHVGDSDRTHVNPLILHDVLANLDEID